VLDAARLGDIARWRGGPSGDKVTAFTVSATPDGLGLAVSTAFEGALEQSPPDARAFVVDTALPLPVLASGPQPTGWALGDPALSPFGGGSTPVRVERTTAALPVLGRHGVLVDLASAQRAGEGTGASGTLQVWLTGGARPALVDRLRAGGLVVLADDTQAARRDRLAAHGPAVAGWFQLLAAAVALLLAAATLGVATVVERVPRAEDLRALRVQGLSARVAASVALAGPALLAGVGVLGGLLAAGVARLALGFRGALFVDGWAVVATPLHPRPLAYLLIALTALLVLGGVGAAAVRPMVKS
jgi:putative ABC transport system permease protein